MADASAPAAPAPAPEVETTTSKEADAPKEEEEAPPTADAATASAPPPADAPSAKKRKRDRDWPDFASRGVGWPDRRPRASPFMHGWFLATHERVFAHVLKQKPKTILELGSWYGASTEWLAKRCPDATIYAVDLWEDAIIPDSYTHLTLPTKRKV